MLGQDGSRFWLHYDNTVLASWQAIVKGKKRFFICPPYLLRGMSCIRHANPSIPPVFGSIDGISIPRCRSESPHLAELRLPKRTTGKISNTGNSRVNPFGGPDNAASSSIPPEWAEKMGIVEPTSAQVVAPRSLLLAPHCLLLAPC